jgi:catechol 2,3-dioxygenase-like lactoylglutathione lyase family enzyme
VIDHVTLRVSDLDAAQRFYDTVLPPIGVGRIDRGDEYIQWGRFSLACDDGPATRGVHIGFGAESREQVDAFWQTGVDAGYESDGEPGERDYTPDYYGGFLLDPDGNSIEAVHYEGAQPPGAIDHLWIRVADLPRAVAFYEATAEFSGFPKGDEHGDHVHFGPGGASFALVDDSRPVTENLHLAFRTASNDVVDAFHAAALAAGYRDNGAPGERPQYHPGYYGAFVLDPDGNNIELVNHNR